MGLNLEESNFEVKLVGFVEERFISKIFMSYVSHPPNIWIICHHVFRPTVIKKTSGGSKLRSQNVPFVVGTRVWEKKVFKYSALMPGTAWNCLEIKVWSLRTIKDLKLNFDQIRDCVFFDGSNLF